MRGRLNFFGVFVLSVCIAFAGQVCAEATDEDPIMKAVTDYQSAQEQELLDKRLKGNWVFENPRFVKKMHGRFQGMQKAVDREHEALMQEQDFKTAEEKEEFKKKLQKNTIVGFDNFNEKPAVVTSQMAKEPAQKTKEIVARMKKMDATQMTNEQEEDLQKRAEALFQEKNGMSVEEYRAMEREQILSGQQNAVKPAKLPENVRYQKRDLQVEKVNETTALIKTVGSEKAK